MDFSQALLALKDGKKLTRQGWSGKDQWVVLQDGYPQGIGINANTAKATGLPEGSIQRFDPYYTMFTAWGSFVPWVPSTGDLNADDWQVYLTQAEQDAEDARIQALADEAEKGYDPDLLIPKPPSLSEAVAAFTTTAVYLHRELVEAKARIQDLESELETQAVIADPQAVADLEDDDPQVFSSEEVRAALGIRSFLGAEIPDKRGATLRLLMQLLTSELTDWRSHFTAEEDTVGWALIVNGRRVDGKDEVTSTEMVIRDLPALEQEQRLLTVVEEPERTQRLTDVFRLRQSFQGTAQPLKLALLEETAAVIAPAGPAPQPAKTRYFLTEGYGTDEKEISEPEYWAEVRTAGWAPDAAVDGFNDGDVRGRVERTPQ